MQAGRKRSGYGARLLAESAPRSTSCFGSGYGVDNLEMFRRFYLSCPRLLPAAISDAASRKSSVKFMVDANSDAVCGKLPTSQIFHAVHGESETLALAAGSWQPGLLHPNFSSDCPKRNHHQTKKNETPLLKRIFRHLCSKHPANARP